jgi:hypothetical protein
MLLIEEDMYSWGGCVLLRWVCIAKEGVSSLRRCAQLHEEGVSSLRRCAQLHEEGVYSMAEEDTCSHVHACPQMNTHNNNNYTSDAGLEITKHFLSLYT